MRTRRLVIISALALAMTALTAFLLYYFGSRHAAEKVIKDYLALDSRVVLPSEYCLENENKTIDEKLLDELIKSLCKEANALMTESFAEYYCELISLKMNAQAAKKYTVSYKERSFQRTVSFSLVSLGEAEIKAEVKQSSTEFAMIEGQLHQYKHQGSDIYLYTFRVKNQGGIWKLDSAEWMQQEGG